MPTLPFDTAGLRRRSPPGGQDYLSRREAAHVLGFGSDFKVRQLEREGRLLPTRGALGQAWYSRTEVLALAQSLRSAASPREPAVLAGDRAHRDRPRSAVRWTDAALISHLRLAQLPTVVDLVADTGISIARAERVYRFWSTHDAHPGAARVRASRHPAAQGVTVIPNDATVAAGAIVASRAPRAAEEQRSPARLARDALIDQLRNPAPGVRADAFAQLGKMGTGPKATGRTSKHSPSAPRKPPE